MEATTTDSLAPSLFERLYQYEFEKQPKFMNAWKKFRGFVPKDSLQESFIKVQVFFYSKEVEKVELEEYQQWLEETVREVTVIEVDAGSAAPGDSESDNTSDKPSSEPGDHRLAGKEPANFMELIEMIQSGLKLPGTDDLNIEPTNEEPTPGVLDRPKKPWEHG